MVRGCNFSEQRRRPTCFTWFKSTCKTCKARKIVWACLDMFGIETLTALTAIGVVLAGSKAGSWPFEDSAEPWWQIEIATSGISFLWHMMAPNGTIICQIYVIIAFAFQIFLQFWNITWLASKVCCKLLCCVILLSTCNVLRGRGLFARRGLLANRVDIHIVAMWRIRNETVPCSSHSQKVFWGSWETQY